MRAELVSFSHVCKLMSLMRGEKELFTAAEKIPELAMKWLPRSISCRWNWYEKNTLPLMACGVVQLGDVKTCNFHQRLVIVYKLPCLHLAWRAALFALTPHALCHFGTIARCDNGDYRRFPLSLHQISSWIFSHWKLEMMNIFSFMLTTSISEKNKD